MPNPATWHSFEAYSVYLETLCSDPSASRVLTLSDGDRVRAIMPLEERREPGLGNRLRVWGVPFHDCWRPTDVIGPEDDARRALLPAAVEHLKRVPGRPVVLVVGQTSTDSVLWEGFVELGADNGFFFPDGAEFLIPTDMCVDDFMAGLSAKSREVLRRARRLFHEYPDAHCVCAVEPGDIAEEFERFLHVEASGWKSERGTAIAQDPRLVAFYRGLAQRVATDGHVEIRSMHADGKCIASEFAVHLRHRVDGLKSGYDPDYSRLSPGRLLTQQTLEWSCGEDEIELVSGVSAAPWMLMWHPRSNELSRGYVALTPVSGRLTLLALRFRYGPMRRIARAYGSWRQEHDDRTVRRRGRDSG